MKDSNRLSQSALSGKGIRIAWGEIRIAWGEIRIALVGQYFLESGFESPGEGFESP